MGIQLISVSYQHAPVEIRKHFSYTKEAQETLIRTLVQTEEVKEAVLISTCNRTELYCYGAEEKTKRAVFDVMQKHLLQAAGLLEEEEVGTYLRFFQDQGAVHHLFQVTAGLNSMVLGEDQILGQVKMALDQAMEQKTSDVYLNTLFRYAITGAKKVKTKTELSKTSVSVASLAIKQAAKELGGLDGKNVLVIGASGKTGTILVKNLDSMKKAKIYATVRNHAMKHRGIDLQLLPYEERYAYMDEMDVIISATKSPHYTITKQKFLQAVKQKKKRVLLDLAVPMDVEMTLKEAEDICYYNIDDFERISEENNRKKLQEIKAADEILEEYEDKFHQWHLFKEYASVMEKTQCFLREEAEKKGMEYAIQKLFYQVRDSVEPERLEAFFQCLEKRNQDYE